ncbi:hypothetical protein [uncultured Trichococcus sp.]|uniref:hypothetical protein n=1 Tax=uncultured Trichococcus sp. TaxID=189665 RepID=UPI0037497437
MLNVDMIEYYFALSHKLAASRRRRIIYPEKFYNEQTMHSYYTYIEGHWTVKGFRQDVQGINFLDAMLALDRYIEILEFKLKHFRLFLRELPMKDKKILIRKYRSKREVPDSESLKAVERLCFSEIQEIEEAVSYRFTYYELPDYLMEAAELLDCAEDGFTESFSENFTAMLQTLGVESK